MAFKVVFQIITLLSVVMLDSLILGRISGMQYKTITKVPASKKSELNSWCFRVKKSIEEQPIKTSTQTNILPVRYAPKAQKTAVI